MLIRFSCKNFRSIGENPITLDMVSSTKTRKLSSHVCSSSDSPKILRNAVIYGANASGKSNLIKAMKFFKDSVVAGRVSSLKTNEYCRTGNGLADKESVFDIQISIDGKSYDYGFGCILKTMQITSEWLYELGNPSKLIFERNVGNNIKIGEALEKNSIDKDINRLKIYIEDFENSFQNDRSVLFLTFLNQGRSFSKDSNLSVFSSVHGWFVRKINIVDSMHAMGAEFYSEDSTLDQVSNIFASFDTGITKLVKKMLSIDELNKMLPSLLIDDIKEELDNASKDKNCIKSVIIVRNQDTFIGIERQGVEDPVVTTLSIKHEGSLLDFEFADESDGTKRIFDFLDMFFSKSKDTVFVVDELNRSLHPMLTKYMVELFNKMHKDDDCQLIFTTHENDIMSLDLFLREEIWFIERDTAGCSKLFSLNKFDTIRADTRLSRQYLKGRYGGIPILPTVFDESSLCKEED